MLKFKPLLKPQLVCTQHRPFYGLMYRIFVKKDAHVLENSINVPKDGQVDAHEARNVNEARDKYVADKLREMLFTMKETKVPKGVWFSTVVMSTPLVLWTSYLAMLSPVAANAVFVDPHTFAYLARTCVRLLSLNIAFFGGIHYGLASAAYDTARNP